VEFRQFEKEFLRLAFTTSIELTPSALAFVANIPVREAEEHMHALVSQGVLELTSDDDGRLSFLMPDRPSEPMRLDDPALIGSRRVVTHLLDGRGPAEGGGVEPVPARAMIVRSLPPAMWEPKPVSSGQAVASMFLNAMVCPGVGSLVGGKTGTGLAQLSLFLVGLPLAVITIGLPLMLAAWVWGIATGAQLIAEARD
jgi:TM2 domain-containing membrane protein YozV